jgi:haloalkane dehalogenase
MTMDPTRPAVEREGRSPMIGPAWLDRAAYPFVHHEVKLSAGRLHFVDEGTGPPILFVHGTPTWSFEYRHLIRALAPAWRAIAPDLLGFGLSSRPQSFPYTPEAHAAALREFVDRIGLTRFALVVHDFGGPIGLPLSLDARLEVTHLVVMNTWMWPLDEPHIVRAARLASGPIGRLLYKYANVSLRLLMPAAYGDRSKLTAAIHQQYLAPFRERDARVLVLHTLARSLTASRDYYARLWQDADRLGKRPTLLVWGLKDRALVPPYLGRWRECLPNARVLTLPDAGHWPHEEAPGEVASAITTLLESPIVRTTP